MSALPRGLDPDEWITMQHHRDAVYEAEAEAVRTALDALRERVEGLKDNEWRECGGNCHDYTLGAVDALIDEARP